MADDEDHEVQVLSNGEVTMDEMDQETHEMTYMNGKEDSIESDTGLNNDAFELEDEESGPILNDSETATEYENQGTLTSYETEGDIADMDMAQYTPPDSPGSEKHYTAITLENGIENGPDDDKVKFIQQEGADDATTRAESRATFKRKTDCKCICLSMLCFLVMLLAAALAFFIGMFVVGSLGSLFGQDSSESTAEVPGPPPPARPDGPTIQAPPINMIMTLAEIDLGIEWNRSYDFPSSPERTELENNITRAIDSVFRWGNTKYVYEKTEIDDLRRGPSGSSIALRFASYFYDVPDGLLLAPADSATTPSSDELYELAEEEMSQLVFFTLAAAIDRNRLASINAVRGTLELLQTELTRA